MNRLHVDIFNDMSLINHWRHFVCDAHIVGYNSSVDASVRNAFATAALRFGHTLLPAAVRRSDNSYNKDSSPQQPLSEVRVESPELLLGLQLYCFFMKSQGNGDARLVV